MYTIYKKDEVIGYLLGAEVAWGNFLMLIMGCSAVKARWIHDGMLRTPGKVADELLDSRMDIETIDNIHYIRAGVFHNM